MRTLFVVVMVGALFACGGSVAPSPDGTDTSNGSSGNTSSGSGSGQGGSAKGGSSSAPALGANCTYPPTNNPSECPPAYTRFPTQPCKTFGLKCWYPGAGDGQSDGCWATALLACNADRDGGGADGDPATGYWTASQ